MDMFSALAEPNRRLIIELIAKKGQLSASEISTQFPISPQAISQHLKILRESGILEMEKNAQQRIYRLNPKAIDKFSQWLKKMTQIWDQRFSKLDQVLEREKQKLKK